MNITIIAAFVIGIIILIAIVVPWIKRRIMDRQHKENEDKIPLFNCSIASEGKESVEAKSADVYDCVEADEDIATQDKNA